VVDSIVAGLVASLVAGPAHRDRLAGECAPVERRRRHAGDPDGAGGGVDHDVVDRRLEQVRRQSAGLVDDGLGGAQHG